MIERLRLVNSGTEAVMSALRLARAFPTEEDYQVRGQLSWPCRLLAGGGRQWSGYIGAAKLSGNPKEHRRAYPRGSV